MPLSSSATSYQCPCVLIVWDKKHTNHDLHRENISYKIEIRNPIKIIIIIKKLKTKGFFSLSASPCWHSSPKRLQAHGSFIQVNASVQSKGNATKMQVNGFIRQTSLSPPEFWWRLFTARPIRAHRRDAWCGLQRQISQLAATRPLCHSHDIPPHCCRSSLRECRWIAIAIRGKKAENTWRCSDYSQLIPQQAIGWERLSIQSKAKQSTICSRLVVMRTKAGGGRRGGKAWGLWG